MLRRGFAFEFELPDGWQDESSGGQLVAHGPDGEELIVSGSLVAGQGDQHELKGVRRALLDNAFQAVREAANVPELATTKALSKEDTLSPCECWTLHGRSTDGEVFFGQAVVASETAVMIATLEAPESPSILEVFSEFLGSIRQATTH